MRNNIVPFLAVMKAFVLMFHFLLPHASGAFGFAPQTAKTYPAVTQAGFNNLNPALWASSPIEDDRKESLFGAMIVPSSDGDALIISAPARKPNAGTYGGDVFKCVIADFPNGCKSITSNDAFRAKIGVPSFHVPLLFGAHMLRTDANHVLVCQVNRGMDLGIFKHCQCLKDTTGEFVDDDKCLVTKHHRDPPITFLNVFQMKFNSDKKWVILGSRHFRASFTIPWRSTTSNFDSGISIWELDTDAEIKRRFTKKLSQKNDWIPTIGFDIGTLFTTSSTDTKTEGLVVATNDDYSQKGKLFIYKFPLDDEQAPPHLTIDDSKWQPFANYGNKIIIMDINKDGKNDLLVTAPTSKWNDLPEVGHAHVFINTGSEPFNTSKSFIIRGEPIAHSFFGWNAESTGDLDGDGVNDFLVAALKVDEIGRPGVYVFLGRDDSLLRELTYKEIIKPADVVGRPRTREFGFYLSTMMNLVRSQEDTTTNDLYISRIYDGEIDVFTITSDPNMLKVAVFVDPKHIKMDDAFMSSLFSMSSQNPVVTISVKFAGRTLSADIKLSVLRSSGSHSFASDYPLETFITRQILTENTDLTYTIHLLPPFKLISIKWILRAEITLKDVNEEGGVDEKSRVFHEIFYPEISFETSCPTNPCFEEYNVEVSNTPKWSHNTYDPISYTFELTNNGDFLTRLKIDASMSIDCEITIDDSAFSRVDLPATLLLKDVESHSHFLYNKGTERDRSFSFTVQALCPRANESPEKPVLKLSIKSALSDSVKEVQATAELDPTPKAELMVWGKISPSISKHVCPDSEVDENVDFDVELMVKSNRIGNLPFSATLRLDGTGSATVVSINIESKGNVFDVSNHADPPHITPAEATQKFTVSKTDGSTAIDGKIKLSISYMFKINASKDVLMTLEVVPVIETSSPYLLGSIVANKAEYHFIFSLHHCQKQLWIVIFAAFGICFVMTCCGYFVYQMVARKFIRPSVDVTYIVDHSDGPAAV